VHTSQPFSFELAATDPGSRARTGTFYTPHGPVEMPAFMPVGTQGTVKGIAAPLLSGTGAQMILANTYHLALRPGAEVVEALGGLHAFAGWAGPILTDSGGFQVFSLAENVRVDEQGVTFRSHLDGNPFELTPEKAVAIQEQLGVDVAMVLDHVVGLPAEIEAVRDASERTIRWAERSLAAQKRRDMALFAIVQGGLDAEARLASAERVAALDFPGYAIGGLSVGEAPAEMYRVLDVTTPALPADRPRYLMGVGRPQDLLEAIRRGVDLFDCVLPTRNGRNALAYTDAGPLRLRNRQYQLDTRPLSERCPCLACRHSRGYLRHLFLAGEMLGPVLVSLHNLTYYQELLRSARAAIAAGRYTQFCDAKLAGWASETPEG
jgi:queuine tRNA-ribosyltransferase